MSKALNVMQNWTMKQDEEHFLLMKTPWNSSFDAAALFPCPWVDPFPLYDAKTTDELTQPSSSGRVSHLSHFLCRSGWSSTSTCTSVGVCTYTLAWNMSEEGMVIMVFIPQVLQCNTSRCKLIALYARWSMSCCISGVAFIHLHWFRTRNVYGSTGAVLKKLSLPKGIFL
jgi:hypothetical protein